MIHTTEIGLEGTVSIEVPESFPTAVAKKKVTEKLGRLYEKVKDLYRTQSTADYSSYFNEYDITSWLSDIRTQKSLDKAVNAIEAFAKGLDEWGQAVCATCVEDINWLYTVREEVKATPIVKVVKEKKAPKRGKTANSATHQGTCQCCGSTQKLPKGVLSQHGYTRKWGFFEGVCQGHGYKPYEEDSSLIPNLIASAEDRLKKEKEFYARVEADTESIFRHTGNGYKADSVYEKDGKHYWTSDDEVVSFYDTRNQGQKKSYLWTINNVIKSIERYIQWQTERLENWKYAPEGLIKLED